MAPILSRLTALGGGGNGGFGFGRKKRIRKQLPPKYLIYYAPNTVNLTPYGPFIEVSVLKITQGQPGGSGGTALPGQGPAGPAGIDGGGAPGIGGNSGVISYQILSGPYSNVAISTTGNYSTIVSGPVSAPGGLSIPVTYIEKYPGMSLVAAGATSDGITYGGKWNGKGGQGGAGGIIISSIEPTYFVNGTPIPSIQGSSGSSGQPASGPEAGFRQGGGGGPGGLGYGAGGGGGGGGSEADGSVGAGGAGGNASSPAIIIIKLDYGFE